MPTKEAIEKKKQSEKDQNFLLAIANQNNYLRSNGYNDVDQNYAIANRMCQAGLFDPMEMNIITYFYRLYCALRAINNAIPDTEKPPKPEKEIDTTNLQIGIPYKNYKALCAAVGEKPKGGKSRILQEQKFHRFFDYEKVLNSQQLIVLEIYDKPLPINENRKSKYVNEVKAIIMYVLYNSMLNEKRNKDDNKNIKVKIEENGTIRYDTTNDRLIALLHLVRNISIYPTPAKKLFKSKYPSLFDYDEGLNNKDSFLYNYKLFYNVVRRKQISIINSALESLDRNDVLAYSKRYVIKYFDDNGGEHERFSTIEEEAKIKQYNRMVANQMGYKNADIATFYDKEEFEYQFNRTIKLYEGWNSVYFRIIISITYANLEKFISDYTALPFEKPVSMLQKSEIQDLRNKLNGNLQSDLKSNAEQQHDKKLNIYAKYYLSAFHNAGYNDCSVEDVISIFDLNNDEKIKRYGEDFVNRMNTLVDELVAFELEPIPEIEESLPKL